MNKVESGLSILGVGCMRLPVTKEGNIDKTGYRYAQYAIDHGVNYMTPLSYHNGESEPFWSSTAGRISREG